MPQAQTGVLSLITGTAGNDTYHLVRVGSELLVYENETPVGQPTYSSEISALPATLLLRTLSGDDSVIATAQAGVALGPTSVELLAGPGANSLQVTGGIASIDSILGSTEALETTVSGGAELVTARFKQSGLTLLGTGSRATLRSTDAAMNVLGSLTLGAETTFDLKGNDLIVRATEATKDDVHADLQAKIISAQNGLDANLVTNWDGPGLTSSTARASNVTTGFDLVSLGVIRNSDIDIITGIPGSAYTSFGGELVGPHDVLVKYTYIGDGNLNGVVSFDDYVGMDNAFFGLIPVLGWATGDVKFDNVINFDDYSRVDQAFFFQGAPLSGDQPSAEFSVAQAFTPGNASIANSGLPLQGLNAAPESEGNGNAATIGRSSERQPISIAAQDIDETVDMRPTVQAADSLADARLASSARSPLRDVWDEALADW